MLVMFHRLFESYGNGRNPWMGNVVLEKESVPMEQFILFSFLHTIQVEAWHLKEKIKSFDAIWGAEKQNKIMQTEVDPHTIGMKEKTMADVHYLSFIKERVATMLSTMYPEAFENSEQLLLTKQDVHHLGFIFGVTCLENKEMPLHSMTSLVDVLFDGCNEDRMACGDVLAFLEQHLVVNEFAYPPMTPHERGQEDTDCMKMVEKEYPCMPLSR